LTVTLFASLGYPVAANHGQAAEPSEITGKTWFARSNGTAADYELMLRFLVKHRITAAYLPEILIQMRS
jgi:hypothetical protein